MKMESTYSKAKRYVESHAKLIAEENIALKKLNAGPCITISRQPGIEVTKICEDLIEYFQVNSDQKNNWAYFDKDLLDQVIQYYQLPGRIKKFLTEERTPALNQMLNGLLGIHPPRLELIHKTAKTILNLAEFGNVIIVGRGSNIITMHLKNSFHIRLVAPLKDRIVNVQKKYKIGKFKANQMILEEDKIRKDFIFSTYHKNVNDPLLYHTVMNVSLYSHKELCKTIGKFVSCKYQDKLHLNYNS